MKNGLEEAYQLVIESQKEGTVKSSLNPGSAAAGDLKKAGGGMGPESTRVRKPQEGEAKINPGHGKIKTESSQKELSSMLPTSKFDSLFNTQIDEADGIEGDESPLEMSGEGEFDDDAGDFPPDGGDDTTGEEVDVATELRMIIDRLSEVAEKLGAYDSDMEDAGDEAGEIDSEPGDEFEPEEELAPESVQKGGPGKGSHDGKIKPFPNTSKKFQGPKSCNRVKSAFNPSSKKAATGAGGPGKGSHDGKLGPARRTDLGPKMSMKANVKGTMGKTGAGVFDNV
ncbi:MAG: hypothetical protein PHS54_00660 [Clostridia bacterium]|nr:hypothetical protein [Clostridia bacterium]